MTSSHEKNSVVKQFQIEAARRRLIRFMEYTWYNTYEQLIIGKHTEEVCNRIDKAIADYDRGISSYICITLPPRHGKSDISSRYLPAYFIGRYPSREMMVVSYADSLSASFSKDTRDRIIDNEQYRQVFNISLDPNSSAVKNWQIKGHGGRTTYSGLEGGITGKGYHLGICDDYFSGREEAESETIREKRWDSFTNDFFTRRAPVSITIVLATRWHEDDVIGRIITKQREDKDFPQFEIISFPAQNEQGEYLFPERFEESYYRAQFSTLGRYAAASIMQCDPQPRTGNIFKTQNIKRIQLCPKNIRYVRAWDLASSTAERIKSDPDYTVGALVGVEQITEAGISLNRIYVADIVRGQWEAGKRNEIIKQTAISDGESVLVAIESIAGYKDAYTTLHDALLGVRSVAMVTTSKDKTVRCQSMEPVFDAGNIFISESIPQGIYDAMFGEFASFPRGKHDDIVDAIATAYNYIITNLLGGGVTFGKPVDGMNSVARGISRGW